MKQITDEQIQQVLQAIYVTNIPTRDFDALKKFLSELPNVPAPESPKK